MNDQLKISNQEREIKYLKSQQEESVRLLSICLKNVGTETGKEISTHLAVIKGQRINPADWNLQDVNGGQGS